MLRRKCDRARRDKLYKITEGEDGAKDHTFDIGSLNPNILATMERLATRDK